MSEASIDLNADVGEGFASDDELVPLVSSVNVACGAHAGDLALMQRTVALAQRHSVAIGAHPGFEDRENFGRKELSLAPGAAADLVVGQVAAVRAVAAALGSRIAHVKLHGALYNMAARDAALAQEVVDALADFMTACGERWHLVGLAGSALLSVGRARGLRVVGEAFADRTYQADGTLTPRSDPGSVIADPRAAVAQALRIARDGRVRAADGSDVAIEAETICLHGDSPGAVGLARMIRAEFAAAGVGVRGLP